jgi:hypothetical protein
MIPTLTGTAELIDFWAILCCNLIAKYKLKLFHLSSWKQLNVELAEKVFQTILKIISF